jgi:TonB family protein
MHFRLWICSAVLTLNLHAQEASFEAITIGGPEQLDQVMQTQMTLPKILLTQGFNEYVTAVFNIDESGHATNVHINKAENNVLRREAARMLKFLTFHRNPMNGMNEEEYLNIKITTEKYNHFFKQKNKHNIKRNLPADSSYIVYTKADQSPEYYKKGEEGLNEFLLSQLEYPTVAVERSIEGTVVLEFIVETNGYITNLSVKKGVNGGCSEEALRLIKLTRWQPAVLNGKLVRYKTTYPVTFMLKNRESNVQVIGG